MFEIYRQLIGKSVILYLKNDLIIKGIVSDVGELFICVLEEGEFEATIISDFELLSMLRVFKEVLVNTNSLPNLKPIKTEFCMMNNGPII